MSFAILVSIYITTIPQEQSESVEQVSVQVPEKPPELRAIDLPSIGVDEMNTPTLEFSQPNALAVLVADDIGTVPSQTNVNGGQQLHESEGVEAGAATPGSTGGGSTGGGSTGGGSTGGGSTGGGSTGGGSTGGGSTGGGSTGGGSTGGGSDDADNDGLTDSDETSIYGTNPHNRDTDSDGLNDGNEVAKGTNPLAEDTDNDTILDGSDECPRNPETFNSRNDTDGCPDSSDPADTDNDSIPDSTDNCPSVSNSNQLDTDNDGMGNACDADDDNDTITDGTDACPLNPENFNGYEDTDGCPEVITTIPDISINNVTLSEGNSGAKDFDFTVTRSGNTTGTSSIEFATADGTATVANSDYASNSGTVNFAAGETTKTLTIFVNGDTAVEPDERFHVNLSDCANCTIKDNQGLGTIQNDDIVLEVPEISIDDVSRNEGNIRSTSFVFSVSRSGNLAGPSSVNYSTADGTATSRIDYDSASGTISFAAGETTKTLTIFVNGDTAVEPDERFHVNLSDCVGCSILDSEGAGSILNDDFPPAPDPCDGVDNNANGIVDEGEVGIDDDGDSVVDEPGESCVPDPCNGLDDNGNGITDEGILFVDDDSDGTVDEGGEACPSDPCNGSDDNSNGIIDEGAVGVDDNDNGTIDEPGDGCPIVIPDTCDGLDNNHNGIIDEGIVGVDDDGDGVTDEPSEACPPPLVDTDGDGVPDGQDLCPIVPGAPENEGCPLR